jgi:hypothetical protein
LFRFGARDPAANSRNLERVQLNGSRHAYHEWNSQRSLKYPATPANST